MYAVSDVYFLLFGKESSFCRIAHSQQADKLVTFRCFHNPQHIAPSLEAKMHRHEAWELYFVTHGNGVRMI